MRVVGLASSCFKAACNCNTYTCSGIPNHWYNGKWKIVSATCGGKPVYKKGTNRYLIFESGQKPALDPAGYTGSVTTSALAALLPGAEDISARELVLHHAGPVRVTAVAEPGAAGGEAIIAIGATEVAPLRTVGPGVVASRVAWQAGGAKLGGAKLEGASFVEAVAPKADFSKTEMKSAKLGGAKLTEASFEQAVALKADFGKAELGGAKLGGGWTWSNGVEDALSCEITV